jgi:hypothetical protein
MSKSMKILVVSNYQLMVQTGGSSMIATSKMAEQIV